MNDAHLELCSSEEWREALEKWIIPYALDGADLGDDVLEIGPGPGMTTDLLRAELARLTSVEIDEELAGSLATRLEGTNVEVVRADATNMPFDDGRFTGAVSFTMLHHVPTAGLQDLLLSEVARVLETGGVLVVSDSIASPELEALHVGDTYNPVDPAGVESRFEGGGIRRQLRPGQSIRLGRSGRQVTVPRTRSGGSQSDVKPKARVQEMHSSWPSNRMRPSAGDGRCRPHPWHVRP